MRDHVELPKDEGRRRELYCEMLGVEDNGVLSLEELEGLCISRGFLEIIDEREAVGEPK